MKQLDTQLGSTTASLKAMLVPVQRISTELSNSAISYKDLVDVINRYKTVEGQAVQVTRQRKTAMDQLAALEKRLADAESKYGKAMAELREQLRQANRENQLAAKATLAHANSIEAMRVKLAQMKAEWATLDTSSDQFKKMTDDIAKLNAEILKNEQAIGVHGRNVGNYSSAFNGLSFSISQVARELPSLTISASQFFLAISNNLPILVDELQRAREANAALRKEGQATVPVWRQLLKGIGSWQTLLVVGITLLTAYGKEITAWVKGLFQGKEALDGVVEAQKRMNEASVEGAKNAAEELATLKLLYSTAINTAKSMKERKDAVKALQDLYPNYLGNISEEEVLLGKAGVAYSNIAKNIMQYAKNQAILNQLIEAYGEQMKVQEEYDRIDRARKDILSRRMSVADIKDLDLTLGDESIKSWGQLSNAWLEARQSLREYQKQITELQRNIDTSQLEPTRKINGKEEDDRKRILEIIQRLREADYNAELEYNRGREENVAEVNRRIVQDDKVSYERRMRALDEYVEHSKRALEMQAQAQEEALIDSAREDLKLPNTSEGNLKAYEMVANQIKVIGQKLAKELENIDNESAGIRVEIEKDRAEQIIASINKVYQARVREASVGEKDELAGLAEQYGRGLIDSEEYERTKTEISRKYAKERFDNEVKYLQDVLATEGLPEEQRVKIEQELEKANLEYTKSILDEEVKAYEDAGKKKEEIEKEFARRKEELLRGAFDLATALYQRETESNLNRLDDESEANQEWADEEAERIDRLEESGAISKEQAEARKAAIDDQAKAREDELENKRRDVQKQQARFEKAMALMQITLSTAKAVHQIQAEAAAAAAIPFIGAALAAAALAQIPVVLASGAVQAAVVAATPIPEYAEGTDDHPGGLAVVGDGGKSEMIISGGKVYKTPAVDTLVDLPRHAVVLPDFGAAAERLPEMPQVNSVVNVDNSKLEALSKENGKLLRQLIRRMEINAKNEIYARELERLRPTKRRSK